MILISSREENDIELYLTQWTWTILGHLKNEFKNSKSNISTTTRFWEINSEVRLKGVLLSFHFCLVTRRREPSFRILNSFSRTAAQ